MCGIVGIFGQVATSHLVANELGILLDSIKHRGPDYRGYVIEDGKFAVGHNRLKINDLTEYSNQPFCKDGLVVLFNGEIYNTKANGFDKELDFIVAAYKTGKDIRYLLEGQFAIVIIDESRKAIIMVRDLWGICPIYYGWDKNYRLIVSSEKKVLALAHVSHTPIEVHPHELKVFSLNDQPRIITEKQPGTNLHAGSGICDLVVAQRLLERSVMERCLHTDVGCSIALSGGLDSCILAKIMKDLDLQAECYTVGFEGSDDTEYAKYFANHFNLNHNTIYVTKDEIIADLPKMLYHLEDPEPNEIKFRSYIRNWFVAKNSKSKVIICGEGADELFAGYPYFEQATNPMELSVIRQRAIKSMRAINLDRVDRGGMAWSKEFRLPYLDYNFAKYILGTVVSPKKGTLKALARILGVPEKIIERPKYGSDEKIMGEIFKEAKGLWNQTYAQPIVGPCVV